MTGSAPAADRSASILRVLALAALVGAAFVVITTARSVVQLWHPVVFWDQWAFVEDLQLQDRGAYGLAELWRQHNEHRILFPRLLFWVDFALFSGRGVFPIGATAALQLALVVTLVRLGARAGTRAAGTTLLHCALAIAGAASSAQMNNLFWGFQVQFAGVYCAAAMAIAALARNGGAAAIALASLLGVVASGMMANGIAIWPLLCVLAWFQRRPYRQVVTLAAIGTATVACYLHGYGSPGAHANPVTSVTEHLPQVLAFVLGYVGSPMRGFGFRACATAGALGLVVLGALAFGILRRRDPARAPAALCAACLFTIGSGFMTALGRIGLEDGTASRYSTSAFLFWSALGGLALARVPANRHRARVAAGVAVLAFVAVQVRFQATLVREYRGWHDGMERGSLALEVGAFGAEALHSLYPVPDQIQDRLRFVHEHQLGSCADEIVGWLGQDLHQHCAIAAAGSAAGSCSVGPLAGASGFGELLGTVPTAGARPELVVCDQRGRVLGLGRGYAVQQEEAGATWSWRANYRHPTPDSKLSVFVLERDHRHAISLGAPIEDFCGDDLPVTAIGAPIAGASAAPEGAFGLGALPAVVQVAPLAGAWYGSGSAGDAAQGSVTFGPFVAPADGFAIPYLSGPSSEGLAVRVIEQSTQSELAVLLRPHAELGWRAWLVPASRVAGKSVLVVGEDHGSGWGQWLAVGVPGALK